MNDTDHEQFRFDIGDGKSIASSLEALTRQGVEVTFLRSAGPDRSLVISFRYPLTEHYFIEVSAPHREVFGHHGAVNHDPELRLIEHIGQVAQRAEAKVQRFEAEQSDSD